MVIVATTLAGLGSHLVEASIMIEISESGSDVVFTTSGSLDTSGLTGHLDANGVKSVFYNSGSGTFRTWVAFGGSNSQDFYEGAGDGLVDYSSNVSWTGASIGGLGVSLDSGPADFGFRTGSLESIWIPDQYVSGTSVTQVLRRSNASFSSLGLNAGDFAEVSWTTGLGSRESIRMQVGDGLSAVPEPGSLAVWGLAVGLGLVIVRRRRQQHAA